MTPVVLPNVVPLGVLDFTEQNKAPANGAENEAALQMISVVTAETHLCLDNRLPPMVDDNENERQLLVHHMMNPRLRLCGLDPGGLGGLRAE